MIINEDEVNMILNIIMILVMAWAIVDRRTHRNQMAQATAAMERMIDYLHYIFEGSAPSTIPLSERRRRISDPERK